MSADPRGIFADSRISAMLRLVKQTVNIVRFSRDQSPHHSRDPPPLPRTQFRPIDPHPPSSTPFLPLLIFIIFIFFICLLPLPGPTPVPTWFRHVNFLQLVASARPSLALLHPVSSSRPLRPIVPAVLPLRSFVVFLFKESLSPGGLPSFMDLFAYSTVFVPISACSIDSLMFDPSSSTQSDSSSSRLLPSPHASLLVSSYLSLPGPLPPRALPSLLALLPPLLRVWPRLVFLPLAICSCHIASSVVVFISRS